MEGISGCIVLVIAIVGILAIWGWLTARRAKNERQDAHPPTAADLSEDKEQPPRDRVQPYGQEPLSDPTEEEQQRQKRRDQ